MPQPEPTLPTTTLVFFYLLDLKGAPVVGATVTFQVAENLNQYASASNHIVAGAAQITTDNTGYGETTLIASSQFQGGPLGYNVSITNKQGQTINILNKLTGLPLTVMIPDSGPTDLTSLLTAVVS